MFLKLIFNITVFSILIMPIWVVGQVVEYHILDKETHKPVSEAQVYFIELNKSKTASEKGKFTVEFELKALENVYISSDGYHGMQTVLSVTDTTNKEILLSLNHVTIDEMIFSVPIVRGKDESVSLVNHHDLHTLNFGNEVSLSDKLTNIAGVDKISNGMLNNKPIVRGLSGNRVLLYKHNHRIDSQQWGEDHGISGSDVGIESIELIKGPASIVYGSDALGGVLYLVDEKPAIEGKMNIKASTQYIENNRTLLHTLGVKSHIGTLHWGAYGSISNIGNINPPNDLWVANTGGREGVGKLNFGMVKKKYLSNIWVEVENQKTGIVEEANYLHSASKGLTLPYLKSSSKQIALKQKFFFTNSTLQMDISWMNNGRQEYEDDIDHPALDLRLSTLSNRLEYKWNSSNLQWNWVTGLQSVLQKNTNFGEEVVIPNYQSMELGNYMLGVWSSSDWQIQSGIRWDLRILDAKKLHLDENFGLKNNVSLKFSIGMMKTINRWKIRTQLATGFRNPNVSELYSDGIHHGSNRYEHGNTELTHEKSWEWDVSFDYHDEHFIFSLSPFYHHIKDFIFLSPSGNLIDNIEEYHYLQASSTLKGGELFMHFHPHFLHQLHLESSISYVDAKLTQGDALPLTPMPKIKSSIQYSFEKIVDNSVLSLKLYHTQRIAHRKVALNEIPTLSYDLWDFGIEWQTRSKQNIALTVNNLFNKEYIDHLSNLKRLGIFQQGRNIGLSVKCNLDFKLKKM